MKKTKILVPALGILLLSTAASVTGTVAWFAVNTSVTITNLQVKAKAEGGIVIAAYTQTSGSAASETNDAGYNNTLTPAVFAAPTASAYANTATMSLTAAELYPTSTADTSAWYHAVSASVNDYSAKAGSYTTLPNLEADGKSYTGDGTEAAKAFALQGQYFLYNKFSIKGTTDGPFSLWVSGITVTGETNSAALNDSLIIAVKVGSGSVSFYAPMYASNDDSTLYYYSGSARTAGSPAKGLAPNTKVANNTITATASDMQVWVYYEGEDPNCKTINAVNVDTLNISMEFTTIDPAA